MCLSELCLSSGREAEGETKCRQMGGKGGGGGGGGGSRLGEKWERCWLEDGRSGF